MLDWTVNIPSDVWASDIKLACYEKAMCMAKDIVDNKWSCREAAKEYLVGKSAVSRWIEEIVKFMDRDLYIQVKHIFKMGKSHTNARKEYL